MVATTNQVHGPPLLEVQGLTRIHRKGNREVTALQDARLEIREGEFVAITGPSGSGKSTLLSLLGLLDRPTSGDYQLLGRDVTTLDDQTASAIRNQLLGFVFQSFHLLPHLSAWRNVALPFSYAPFGTSIAPAERKKRALAALESVGMLEHADHLPRELSGGQEQRVAIARSLVNNPKVILADEPTGNLDTKTRDDVLHLFEQANCNGVTIIVITHDPDVAARAKRIIQMEDGHVAPSLP